MAKEYETVDVWFGTFPSAEMLESYFAEKYDPDDDDEPISGFAADQRPPFYDHDFVEYGFHKAGDDPCSLLSSHSFSESYISDVRRIVAKESPGSWSSVVLAWGHAIDEPLSVESQEHTLRYLGNFNCDPRV